LTGDVVAAVFDASTVMEIAGPQSYPLRVAYHREGRVQPEAGNDTRLRATVRGTLPYVVELRVDAGRDGHARVRQQRTARSASTAWQ
jgi:hypothetical protein